MATCLELTQHCTLCDWSGWVLGIMEKYFKRLIETACERGQSEMLSDKKKWRETAVTERYNEITCNRCAEYNHFISNYKFIVLHPANQSSPPHIFLNPTIRTIVKYVQSYNTYNTHNRTIRTIVQYVQSYNTYNRTGVLVIRSNGTQESNSKWTFRVKNQRTNNQLSLTIVLIYFACYSVIMSHNESW